MRTIVFSFCIIILTIGSGCKKPPNPIIIPPDTLKPIVYENSFILDSQNYIHFTLNFKTTQIRTSEYSQSTQMTSVIIEGSSGDSLNLKFEIGFSGNYLRHFESSGGYDYMYITVKSKNNPSNLNRFEFRSGKVEVLQYDNVGGKVIGNFTGIFTGGLTNLKYSISGKFSAIRTDDSL